MKKLFTLMLAVLAFQLVQAQDSETKPKTPIGGRPNIPNDLSFEIGFNQLNNRPEDLSQNFFGSRTFNVVYQFPIKLLGEGSGFTINPGIGVGTDKIEFSDNQNLFINPALGAESSRLQKVTAVYGEKINIRTNNFAVNYIEVPIDIRYHLNKSNYSKSFRFSLGGKVGFLYESHNKVKYESAETGKRKVKDSQNYGLEQFRYGLTLKAGSPGFYTWGYFGLSDMFQKGRGPFATTASQISFGLAFTVF
jgi:hypothetical protein